MPDAEPWMGSLLRALPPPCPFRLGFEPQGGKSPNAMSQPDFNQDRARESAEARAVRGLRDTPLTVISEKQL